MATLRNWVWIGPILVAACGSGQPAEGGQVDGANLSTDFSYLEIVSRPGWVWFSPAPGSDCSNLMVATYELQAANHQLDWDECLFEDYTDPSVYRRHAGSRTLSETEFSSVLDALAQVKIGGRGVCIADGANITLDLTVHGIITGYVIDSNSCHGSAPDGRTYVSGDSLQVLTSALDQLSGV